MNCDAKISIVDPTPEQRTELCAKKEFQNLRSYTYQQLRLKNYQDQMGVRFAILSGEPVGFVIFSNENITKLKMNEMLIDKSVSIANMFVPHQHRRKGIATALVKAVEHVAKARSVYINMCFSRFQKHPRVTSWCAFAIAEVSYNALKFWLNRGYKFVDGPRSASSWPTESDPQTVCNGVLTNRFNVILANQIKTTDCESAKNKVVREALDICDIDTFQGADDYFDLLCVQMARGQCLT